MNWETILIILFAPLMLAEFFIAIFAGILLIKDILEDWRK